MRVLKIAIVIIFCLLLLVIVYHIYASNQVITRPISVLGFAKYSSCIDDDECVWSRAPRCDSCGCGAYVNKSLIEEYREKVDKLCVEYEGPVCGMTWCPETKPKCKEGKCVGVGGLFFK